MSDYTLLAETRPVARKPHRCIWCGQTISAGERYIFQRFAWEGTVQSQHWHDDCADAQQQEGRETGDWEFLPHENERPVPALPTNPPHPETK